MPNPSSTPVSALRRITAAVAAAGAVSLACLVSGVAPGLSNPAIAASADDLLVIKAANTGAAGPGVVYNGDTITYTITVTNPSSSLAATSVLVVDALPPDTLDNLHCADACEQVIETTVVPEPTGGTVVVSATRQLSWTIASLAPGASVQRSFSGRVAGQSDGTTFTNRVFVSYHQGGSPKSASSNELPTTARVRIAQTGVASISPVPTWFSRDLGGTISQDWGDYDRDGDLDLALASSIGLSIYRNDSGRLTRFWGIERQTYGVAWGDFLGDGSLAIVALGDSADDSPVSQGINYVYRHDGSEFVQAGVFTSEQQLVRVVPGDFRGLGVVDLVASTNFINAACPVRLFRNDGAGNFSTAADDCISTSATAALSAADIDNNGTLDVAMGVFPHHLQVKINDGSGTFSTTLPIDGYLPFLPFDLKWGDLDADGFLDLAAAYPLQREARVYRNVAGAGFDTPIIIPTSLFWTPLTVDWADFHGTGRLDLVVADSPPAIYQYENGAFAIASRLAADSVTGRIWSLRGVRILPDGDLNLSVSNRDGPSLLFDGLSPHLAAAITPIDPAPASSVAWGDANGDGALDLAMGAGSPPAVGARIYYNTRGALTITNKLTLVPTGLGPQSLAFGDADANGRLDLAIGAAGETQLYMANQTAPAWTSALPVAADHVVAWGDADNNGTLDLLTGGIGGPVGLYLNRSGLLSPLPDYQTPITGSVTSLAWCDLDRDGFPDFVAGRDGQSTVAFHNDRRGSFAQIWDSGYASATTSIACADYNGDSYPDLAVGNYQQETVIFENMAGALGSQPAWVAPVLRNTTSIAWGDWNNDGYPELAVGNRGEPAQVYANLASAPAAPRLFWAWTSAEIPQTTGVVWGDLSGDGYLDLALSQDGGGYSGVYANTTVAGSRYTDIYTPTMVLPNNPSFAWLSRPGNTDDGYLNSSAEILSGPSGPTVTVHYLVFDPDGSRVTAASNVTGTGIANTVFEYSLDGGSTWHRASRDVTSPQPITHTTRLGLEGIFVWDAVADQAISDDARFRVRVISADRYGPVQRAASTAISPPFRVRATTCIWPEDPIIYTYPVNPPPNTAAYLIATLRSGSGALVFAWDFGDGSPIEYGQTVQHTFTETNDYTVTLTVMGEPCPTNRERVVTATISVGTKPPAYRVNLPLVYNKAVVTSTTDSPTSDLPAPGASPRTWPAMPASTISLAGATPFSTPRLNQVASPSEITAPGAPCSVTLVSGAMVGVSDQAVANASGDRIAFWSTADLTGGNHDGSIEVFLAELGSGGAVSYTQVTSSTGSVLGGFNFSPSLDDQGRRVAFYSERDLTGGNADGNFEIFLAELTAGRAVTISQITTSTIGASILPSISSDGRLIAFASDRNMTTKNPDGNTEIVLAVVDASGTITYSVVTRTTGGSNTQPSLSRNGSRVAFLSDRDLTGANPSLALQVFVSDLNVAAQPVFYQVTSGSGGWIGRPSVSSTGQRVAFASDRDLTGGNASLTAQIFLADVDGLGNVTLTQVTDPAQGSYDQPVLSSDGTRIAFVSLTHGSVFLFDAVTNAFFQISANGSGSLSPAVDRDGVRLTFTAGRGVYGALCPMVDLAVSKVSQPPAVLAGEGIAYTIVITNLGPSPASGVTLADSLAPELQEVVPPDQVDDDNSATGFGGGVFRSTRWSSATFALDLDLPLTAPASPLPDGRANTWVNMAGNALLLHLNETAGARVFSDTSGLGNSGVCASPACPVAGAGGKLGSAITFDGLNDAVTVPYTNGLNIEGRITMMGWVNALAIDGTHNIIAHGPGGPGVRDVYLRIKERAYEVGTFYTGVDHQARSLITSGAGTWVHVAGVYDGGSYRLYVNGTQRAATQDIVGPQTVLSNWGVGAAADGASRYFAGSLDELAVFSRALSADEIQDVYNRQAPLFAGFSGSFDSRIMDARAPLPWQTLSWQPSAPMGKSLPNYGQVESGYSGGLANMAGNTLLLHFAEIAGSTSFTDTSGNNRIGTCVGAACPTAGAPGRLGKALRFDGANDLVTVMDPPDPTAYTVEMWVRPAVGASTGLIARTNSYGTGSEWSHQLRINSAGKFEHYTFDGNGRSVVGTSVVVPGLWYHVAAVATSNGPMRLYVNGHEEGAAASVGNLWTGGDRWVVGAGWGLSAGQPLNGYADEVAIFNRVLSAQEIYDHYRRGAMSASFQVRSCSTVSCTLPSEVFTGPDGTSATYYTEISNTTTTPPTVTVTVPANRYFQYRAYLETDSLTINPDIARVASGPSHESVTTSQGSCTGTRDIRCDVGALQAGQTATVTIVSQVSAVARGQLLNVADVASAETERNRANNGASVTTNILADTDLAVTQTTTLHSAVAGMPFTYTVWARNNGPKPATNVQVYDRLPDGAGLSYIPGECQYDGTLVVCSLNDMQPGDTHLVVVVAQIGPDARGTVTNTAGIGSSETDPDTGNNTSILVSPVTASADLTLLLSAADTVMAGTSITYTLNAENWGPSTATGVVITNALPLSATQIVTSSYPYSVTGNLVTWSVGAISPTTSISLTIEVTVSGSARVVITDTAGARAVEPDPNLANNTSSRETLVTAQADLVLTKQAEPSLVTVGGALTYTLSITNVGPSDAFDVVLTDTLPPSLTLGAVLPVSTCVSDAAMVTCTLGTVPAATTPQVVIQTTVARKAPAGVITNSTAVTSTTSDPDLASNATSAVATIRTMADLEVTKTAPGTVVAGTGISYTMTVTNYGPSDATSVIFTDTLPAIAVVSTSPGCSLAGGLVTCDLGTITDVPAQNTRQITITATVPATTTVGSVLNNTATAAGNENDDVAANNVGATSTVVNRLADLTLALAASSEPVLAGNYLTYTLTLTNTGPSDASAVTVSDTLPGGVIYTSASPECSHSAGVVTCLMSTQPASTTQVLTVTVLVPSSSSEGALLFNQAGASAAEPDPNPSGNAADVTTTVHTRADLEVTKWTQAPPILAGGLITYTVAITNYGPSDAASVLITDSLPAAVTVVVTPAGWTRPGASLLGDLGAVAGGESRQFTIAVSVPTGTPKGSLLTNAVTIAGATEDLGPAPNAHAVTSTTETSADLALSKVASPDPVFLASPLTYTLVITNLGPSDAMNVVLTDTLPSGVALVSASASSGTCTSNGGAITCTLGNSVSGPNLLANPGAESGTLSGWTVLANGGAGWSVTASAAHDGTLSFATSTAWDTRSQEVDLVASGLPSAYLDLVPAVNLEEWFRGFGNLPDAYYLKAELRRSDHSAIASWNAGSAATPMPVGAAWEQAGTAFAGYGSGARYLYFEDGGVAAGILPDPVGALMDSALVQVSSRAAPPGVYTVTILVNVTASTGGALTNTTAIASGTADPDVANNQASVAPMAQTNANLSIVKTASASSLAAGEYLTYTLTVANPLAAAVTAVVVTDALPSDVITISVPSGCTGAAPLTCSLGDMAPNSTTILTITTRVDPAAAAGVITNTAGVTSTTNADPAASNNSAAFETIISHSTDLVVAQGYAPAIAMQRQSVYYTVTVTNTGPSLATGVVVTDELPADLDSWSTSVTQGACGSGGTFDCALGSLNPGASARLYVTATVSSGARVLTNTTWVSGLESDPDVLNNTVTTTITVKQADLAIAKSASNEPAYAGAPLTYTLTITNLGPDGATGVVVTDTLPPTVTFTSASSGCGLTGSQVVCTLGSLSQTSPNNTAVITVAVTVSGTAPHQSEFTNSVTVAGLETDPDTANDTASAVSTVERRANLSLSKSASSDPAIAGTTLTYTLLLVNNGPDAATGLVVTDTLPVSVTYRSASPICTETGGIVTCPVGNLSGQAGANTRSLTVTVNLPVTLTEGAILTNTAVANAAETDLTPNNTATRAVSVARQIDLAIAKWAQAATATAGNTITFTIAITNLGISEASGVTITDTLPVSTTFAGATGSEVHAGGMVTWTVADLLPTESATVSVWANVDAAAASGPVTNTAHVSSSEVDLVTGNNADEATVSIRGYADLMVTKVAIPDPPIQKQTMTYVVTVTNQGPAPATSVRLTDTLPSTLSGPNDTVSQGTCTGTSTVACQLGSLAAGASATLRITGTVQNHTTSMENVARTSAFEVDSVTTDNVFTLTTNTRQADLVISKAASAEPAIAGTTLTYTIRVTNTGPDQATGVTMVDTLPADAVYQSSSAGCAHSGGTITCTAATLNNGNSTTFTVAVGVPATTSDGTTWANAVTVDANETDPDLSDNTYSLDTTIGRRADLTVTKAVTSQPVVTGGVVTFTVTVTNTGPSEATSVALTDTLPVSTTFATASSGYVRGGRALTWTLGTLAPQATISVTCAVTVDMAASGNLVNTAGTWGVEEDPTSPNVASATATVSSTAPVSLTVSGPLTGTLGTVSTFTATVNVTATWPITYVWTISPTLAVTHSASYAPTDTISLTWATTGTLVLTATATNVAGSISGTLPTEQGLTYLAAAALPPDRGIRVFLPIVVRLEGEP